jgi:hypothetical protein
MIIFGNGREDIDFGPIHPQDCEACGTEQPFHLRLLYRYEHLFFIFGHARGKSYVMVCQVCGTAYRVPRVVAWKLGRLNHEPIPFLRRYGCLMVFAAFLLIATLGVFLAR